MQQSFDFIESINDALGAAVRALGGAKKVGPMLKPGKTTHEAQTWVTDCLNPDRAVEFHPEHIMQILREAKKVGFHASITFINQDAGYSEPVPVDPEDEKERLMREFIEATKQATRNVERMEALNKTTLRAVA